MLRKIYKSIEKEIDIRPLPAARAEQELLQGNADGEIMRIYSYGLGNEEVVRVPTPYYILYTRAFIRRGSDIKLKSKESLNNYTVARIRGVKHTQDITKGIKDVYDLEITHQMMNFLVKGRADIVLSSSIDGGKAIRELGLKNIVPIIQPLSAQRLYQYLHIDHASILPAVDDAINRMKTSIELITLTEQGEKKVLSTHY